MTTETDKLVEMALSDAFEEGWRAAAEWAQREDLRHDIDSPAYSKERDAAIIREVPKLRAAIIADLTADVEPSLYTYTANGTYTMLSDAEPPDDAYDTGTLVRHYPATTVAALKARMAELERALERIANPILYEQANVPEGYSLDGRALLAQINRPEYYQGVARAALTKGQLAPQPQQEQSK